ncbi:MAG: hypothetical protein ACK5ZV_08190, partial [bacterium]
AAAFFARPEVEGFDCVPVEHDERIIGMVYRVDLPNAPGPRADEAMRPLHCVPTISGAATVDALIRAMHATNEHFWLVLNDTAINAIVTRSDLARLPVRMLTMCRIVHLERLMDELIRTNAPDEAWVAALTDKRRAKLSEVKQQATERNEQIDLLESTSFSDKIEILRKHLGRKADADDLGGINTLRDQLMHARESSSDEAGINQFLRRFHRLDQFVEAWTRELRPDPATSPPSPTATPSACPAPHPTPASGAPPCAVPPSCPTPQPSVKTSAADPAWATPAA